MRFMFDDHQALHRTATILSLVGHPFILIPTTVALTTRAAWIGVGVAGFTVIAMLTVIAYRVRSGQWSDHDVSDEQQRHSFYPVAIGIAMTSTVMTWLLGVPAQVVRGFGAGVCMLVAAAVITRWTKISLHMMLGTFCAATVITAGSTLTLPFVVLVAGVGWSRVALGRHTLGQVAIGGIVGGLGGVALILINAFA